MQNLNISCACVLWIYRSLSKFVYLLIRIEVTHCRGYIVVFGVFFYS